MKLKKKGRKDNRKPWNVLKRQGQMKLKKKGRKDNRKTWKLEIRHWPMKLQRKQRTENRKHITTNPTAHSHELPPPKPNVFHQNFISKNEIPTQRAITKKNIDFQK